MDNTIPLEPSPESILTACKGGLLKMDAYYIYIVDNVLENESLNALYGVQLSCRRQSLRNYSANEVVYT